MVVKRKYLKGVITSELRMSTNPKWAMKSIAELFQLFIFVTTRKVSVFPITAVTNTQHRITENVIVSKSAGIADNIQNMLTKNYTF
jgi:hypothetical protein